MHIDHIGIAVDSIEASEDMYHALFGLRCFHYETIEDQGVKVGFIEIGQQKLELLESLTPDGPIAKFIDKRGPGIHHVAYKVEDILLELEKMAKQGFTLIDERPRRGALGKWVAFLHPKSTQGVLIELCQSPKDPEHLDRL